MDTPLAPAAEKARLTSRPRAPAHAGKEGLHPLHRARGRDALLHVPPGAGDRLVVLLHGAGGDAEEIIGLLQDHASRERFLLLAPSSRGATWDVLRGGFGADVAFLDRALDWIFERHEVSPERIAIAGFSDGASYALTLGLANGDLFREVIAFSPGFAAPPVQIGRPRVFVSHGVRDGVLPIERCSRQLVPELEHEGYAVDYVEFAGGHTVPPAITTRAIDWLARVSG